MVNKINNERRRSMNATPTRPSKKGQAVRSPGGPQSGQVERQSTDRTITQQNVKGNKSNQ
jgi:hypothetical protein